MERWAILDHGKSLTDERIVYSITVPYGPSKGYFLAEFLMAITIRSSLVVQLIDL